MLVCKGSPSTYGPVSYTHLDIVGSLYVPDVGFVEMFTFTFALLQATKDKGAEVLNETEVTGLIQNENRILGVHTSKGDFPAIAAI